MHQILSPIGPLLPIMQVKAEYVFETGYYFLNINHTLTIQWNYDFFFKSPRETKIGLENQVVWKSGVK